MLSAGCDLHKQTITIRFARPAGGLGGSRWSTPHQPEFDF